MIRHSIRLDKCANWNLISVVLIFVLFRDLSVHTHEPENIVFDSHQYIDKSIVRFFCTNKENLPRVVISASVAVKNTTIAVLNMCVADSLKRYNIVSPFLNFSCKNRRHNCKNQKLKIVIIVINELFLFLSNTSDVSSINRKLQKNIIFFLFFFLEYDHYYPQV